MDTEKNKFIMKLNAYIKFYYKAPKKTLSHRSSDVPPSLSVRCEKKKKSVGPFKATEECMESSDIPDADSIPSISKEEFFLEPTFQEKLFQLIDEKNLKDPDVYKASMIDKRLFSKIRSDKNYSPSKNTVIQFCFGLKLEIDTALDLLSSAGYTLSFSVLSDVIVRFYLKEKNYDLIDLNNSLYERDLKPIFE